MNPVAKMGHVHRDGSAAGLRRATKAPEGSDKSNLVTARDVRRKWGATWKARNGGRGLHLTKDFLLLGSIETDALFRYLVTQA